MFFSLDYRYNHKNPIVLKKRYVSYFHDSKFTFSIIKSKKGLKGGSASYSMQKYLQVKENLSLNCFRRIPENEVDGYYYGSDLGKDFLLLLYYIFISLPAN